MKNYRLKTSEGVRDYLGNEALLKEKVETNVRNFLLHLNMLMFLLQKTFSNNQTFIH